MNKRHHRRNIIESKLEQLPAPDIDFLWNDMHSILDKNLPQKKEKRRFIVWWFLSGKGLLLLTIGALIITGSFLFHLSTKESPTGIVKELPGSPQSNKSIEGDGAKISREREERITAAGGPDQITNDNSSTTLTKNGIAAKTPSISAVENVIKNNVTLEQTTKLSKKYISKDQFSQPIQHNSKATTNFDSAPVYLKSIYQDFLIAQNDNTEKDSLDQQLKSLASKTKTNGRNNNESGFYAGIITGIDLSSIHLQSVKTGATMGLIFGYALNKRWSIESGLLWDTKRVYDNGSYFNPPGYIPTNGIKIIAVNGTSRLYEWPVNMKYTIILGKHSLFTTAGLSSYLMRSENYDYEYLQNNQPGGHNYLTYSKETKNWFSVANLSIGYTHKLGGNGSIRVEPYLKLPIKDLGVGNMPIMSTGLNIGFTKPLRR